MLKIQKYDNQYYINLVYEQYLVRDCVIAEELNISPKMYENILRKCNGDIETLGPDEYKEYCFKDKGDAEQALKMLEPYIVMNKLSNL